MLCPINMVLHCPNCGMQHIDAPSPQAVVLQERGITCTFDGERGLTWSDGVVRDYPWANPPHKSHLCHGCGHIWRPADVPTNGVAAVKTKGKDDSPLAQAGWKFAEIERLRERVFELEADPKSGDVIPLAEPRQGAS